MQRIKVLLPEPLAPMITVADCAGKSMETSSRTKFSPKDLRMFLTSKSALMATTVLVLVDEHLACE